MRIICTLNDQSKGRQLSAFLTSEGIENKLEMTTNNDWGSSDYGDISCKIWVYDEDQLATAMRWVELFQNDPNNEAFKKAAAAPIIPIVLPKLGSGEDYKMNENPKGNPRIGNGIKTPLTSYLILICCILFFIDMTTAPVITSIPTYLPPTPLVDSPIRKQALYDYPKAYEIVDKLVKLYGVDKLQTPGDLPKEGQYLLQQFMSTPYWKGIYLQFFNTQPAGGEIPKDVPMFEKIREGEFWRTFTPCLMHYDIFHILFNMIWLIVLGKQMEQRLLPRKYFLFILFAGIFSNTCQYIMSGANFLGISGVLCAMLTFIWMRQKYAPWEGYPLEKSTVTFMLFFIIAMSLLQAVSLYLETHHQISISPGIANTAHLSGAAFGLLLGRLSLFAWKHR